MKLTPYKLIATALTVVASVAMLSGCSTAKKETPTPIDEVNIIKLAPAEELRPRTQVPDGVAVTAPVIAYRMSGDYADNVPITLTADGEVLSYPAPSDLTATSTPIALADGWWLDRRGVSMSTVFTRYTYDEYRALEQVPTPAELLKAVIPGARVTATLKLPMSRAQAIADTAAVDAYIAAHTAHPHL